MLKKWHIGYTDIQVLVKTFVQVREQPGKDKNRKL